MGSDTSGFCVYILRSERSGRYYVGATKDLARRLSEHESGENKSTRNRGPWKLAHVEHFATNAEARRHEQAIKHKKSARYVQQLIASGHGERAPKAFGEVAGSNPAAPTTLR